MKEDKITPLMGDVDLESIEAYLQPGDKVVLGQFLAPRRITSPTMRASLLILLN